ncbi:MAG: hypothetical protein ACR2JW_20615 [Thermomicrobiales bacterium]
MRTLRALLMQPFSAARRLLFDNRIGAGRQQGSPSESADSMAIMAPSEQRRRGRTRARPIAIASDALTLTGVMAGSVPLFVRGWVHVEVLFAPRNPSGGVLRRLGAEVDTQIAAITAHEINAAISPTLWQYPSHLFQALFALLLFVAAATLLAPALPERWRVVARASACLSSVITVTIVAVAFVRINTRIAALPARITEAMQGNALVAQTLAATESTPQVSGGPGWPMIVVAVGVDVALLGACVGLILALRPTGTPGILPSAREMPAGKK